MRNLRLKFVLIIVVTFASIIIDLPSSVPVKIRLGKKSFNFTLTRPQIKIGNLTRDINLKEGLDIQGGSRLVYEAQMDKIAPSEKLHALESAKQIIERRTNLFGVSEPLIQSVTSQNSYRIVIELPGIRDIESAKNLIGKTAQLEFRELKNSSPSALLTSDNTLPTGVTGADMKSFQVTFSSQDGTPSISFETTDTGRDKFAALTKKLIGKPLIATLDSQIISVATVQTEIVGQGQITGSFTVKEAKELATLFNAGSLPVPLYIIEQKNIGATLGRESIQKSVRGGIVGLVMVILFMTALYGKLGLVADAALIIYGLITLALYKLIPVTLTLPGIAGFILSVGMAVDGNILIFERIKEELRMGKSWSSAMELGFVRAWNSIKDANIATLITTFVLFNPFNWNFLNSSGLVRGFALTLFLGISISLFTGIVVTRTFIRVFFANND